jgi:ribonuclease Z
MQDPKDWPSAVLPTVNLHVSGHSRAGEATGFYLRQLKWFLDAGVPTSQLKPERVFITHSHTDHSMMLPLLVNRTKTMQVYAPKEAVGFIEEYVAGMNRMNQQSSDWADRSGGYHYIPVTAGQVIQIDNKYWVEIIECEHPVTSVGYCFFEKRKKLKEDLKGKTKQELGQLRKQGIELNEEVKMPAFAFLGDSTKTVIEKYGELLATYPVIFIECTFIFPDHKTAADESMHIHWSELKPFVLTHPNTTFILIHFSKRYGDDEIRQFFAREKAEEKEKITNEPVPTDKAAAACSSSTSTTNQERQPLDNIVLWLNGLKTT